MLVAVVLSRPNVECEQSGYFGTNLAAAVATFQLVRCVRVTIDQLVADDDLARGHSDASLRCPLGLIVREPLVIRASKSTAHPGC